MISIFLGSKEDADVFLKKFLGDSKNKDRELVLITDSNFSEDMTSSYFGAEDIFGKKYIIYLDRIFANSEAKKFFWSNLNRFTDSLNEFVLFEEKLSADDIKSLEKEGGKLTVSKKLISSNLKSDFNIFSLADSLGERDKKNLWVLYEKALRVGKAPEEIAGTLFWQLKVMLLVSKGGGTFLHPYVKGKTARFVKKYSVAELEKISFSLIDEYHKSRLGGLPLAQRLERFILSI